MKKKNSGSIILIVALGFVLFSTLEQTEPRTSSPKPSAAGLAIILDSFAYNLELDGQAERPVIEWSNQVGEAINAFGARSTLGASYRSTFASEFDALALDLKAALGVTDAPRELTTERRAAAVAVLRRHARGLK